MRPTARREYGLTVTRTSDGPIGADWTWRVAEFADSDGAAGSPLASGVRLFHDAGEVSVTSSPQGVTVTAPDAGFVSLAIDLPRDALTGLGPHHVLHVAMKTDGAAAVFARLNLRIGAATVTRTALVRDGRGAIDLDQAIDPGATVDHAWIDLIADRPGDRVDLRDIRLTRAFRLTM